MVTEDSWGEGNPRLIGDGSHPFLSIWRDTMFDAIEFNEIRLSFTEDFPSSYRNIHNKSSLELSNMVEAHMLKILWIELVQWEKHTKSVDDLKFKLANAREALTPR